MITRAAFTQFRRRRLRTVVFAGWVIALSGCAVLTVDVDVYKGVLSNEQETQVNQLIALAESSQELLINLFNNVGQHHVPKLKLVLAGSSPRPDQQVVVGQGLSALKLQRLEKSAAGGEPSWKDVLPSQLGDVLEIDPDDQRSTIASLVFQLIRLYDGGDRGTFIAKEAEVLAMAVKRHPELLSQSSFRSEVENLQREAASLNIMTAKSLSPDVAAATVQKDLEQLASEAQNLTAMPEEEAKAVSSLIDRARNAEKALQTARLTHTAAAHQLAEDAIADLRSAATIVAGEILHVSQYGRSYRKSYVNQALELVSSAWHGYVVPVEDQFAVLQAVGNSMLCLADELQHQQNWTLEDRKRATYDLNAAQAVLFGDGFAWLNVWQRRAEAAAERAASDTDKQAWKDIVDAIGSVRAAAVKDATRSLPSGQAAFQQMLTALKDEPNALRLIRESFHPASDLAGLPPADGVELSQADIANATLSTLRAYRAQLLLEGQATTNLDKTIAQISESKADAIPLRPAGAILRTASTIPGLQDNASLRSPNMLSSFLVDAIPVVGPGFHSFWRRVTDPDYNPRLSSALDRTFWQPINHVAVQGLGDTNYVLVKDDVGNWYVKTYAADPAVAFEKMGPFVGATMIAPRLAAAAGVNANHTSTVSADVADFLKLAQEQDAADHGRLLDELRKQVEKLSTGEGGSPNPTENVLKDRIAAAGGPKASLVDREQALLGIGRAYALERLYNAEAAKSAAKADADAADAAKKGKDSDVSAADAAAKAKADAVKDAADKTKAEQEQHDAESKLADAQKAAQAAADDFAAKTKKLEAANKEFADAQDRLKEFKAAAKVYFEGRAKQLEDRKKTVTDKLFSSIPAS